SLQGSLQLGSIKLAIAKQCDGRIEWDQLLQTANERAMELLGQVALFAFDDRPQQWNGPPRIDHAGHQDDTAASGGRAIEQDGQGQLRQSLEQRTSKRQPEGVGSDVLVLDEASKARDQTFVLATTDRGMAGEFVELKVLGADDATNQQGQRVEVLLGMAGCTSVQCLRQRAFDGTIGLEVDV